MAARPDRPLRPLADRAHPHRQRAHRADQLAVRAARRRPLHPALRRHRPRALAAPNTPTRSRPTSPGSESSPISQCRQSERMALYEAAAETLQRAGRLYPAYETAEELDRRRKRQQALGRPPIYDRAALRLTDADRAALEAQGRKPHWRFKLEPTRGALGRPGARAEPYRLRLALRSRAASARTAAISTRCPRWSTTSTSASPTSSAATITSPTPRCRSRSSRRWRRARRPSATTICSPTPSGEGLSKRTGALSIRSLRESGVEALAVAALAVLVGSAEAVRPVASLAELAAAFDLADLSRGAARFDEAELRALSARMLHHLPFAAVRERLEALGVAGPLAEPFWAAMRGNLARFDEAADVVAVIARRDRADRRGPRVPRAGGRLPAARAVGRGDLGRLDGDAQDADRPQGPRPLPPAAAGADRPRSGAGTRRAAAADRPRQSVGSIIRTCRLTPSGPTTSTVWPWPSP